MIRLLLFFLVLFIAVALTFIIDGYCIVGASIIAAGAVGGILLLLLLVIGTDFLFQINEE